MQTRGLAGFIYKKQPQFIYQNENAEPGLLGIRILKELTECEKQDKWEQVKTNIEALISVDETESLTQHRYMHRYFRRHLPKHLVRSNATDVYELFEPIQGSFSPYLDGVMKWLPDSSSFARDSKFCKWVYVLNLDSMNFEILKGDQAIKAEPLFGVCRGNEFTTYDETKYYPCKLMTTYDLNKLPSKSQLIEDLH